MNDFKKLSEDLKLVRLLIIIIYHENQCHYYRWFFDVNLKVTPVPFLLLILLYQVIYQVVSLITLYYACILSHFKVILY